MKLSQLETIIKLAATLGIKVKTAGDLGRLQHTLKALRG